MILEITTRLGKQPNIWQLKDCLKIPNTVWLTGLLDWEWGNRLQVALDHRLRRRLPPAWLTALA